MLNTCIPNSFFRKQSQADWKFIGTCSVVIMAFKIIHISHVKSTNIFHHCRMHGILFVYNDRFLSCMGCCFLLLPTEKMLGVLLFFNIIIKWNCTQHESQKDIHIEEKRLIVFSEDIINSCEVKNKGCLNNCGFGVHSPNTVSDENDKYFTQHMERFYMFI